MMVNGLVLKLLRYPTAPRMKKPSEIRTYEIGDFRRIVWIDFLGARRRRRRDGDEWRKR
jgi:hypothetical protein